MLAGLRYTIAVFTLWMMSWINLRKEKMQDPLKICKTIRLDGDILYFLDVLVRNLMNC